MITNWVNAAVSELDIITIGTIASFLSVCLSGNESLLVLVQYLFLIDLVLLVFTSTARSLTKRIFIACKKYISLYLGVILVGIGTKAFDVAISSTVKFTYSGTFFFDMFLYILIVYELAAINRHLARCGFAVNIGIQKLYKTLVNVVFRKLKVPLEHEDIDNLMEETKETDKPIEVPEKRERRRGKRELSKEGFGNG